MITKNNQFSEVERLTADITDALKSGLGGNVSSAVFFDEDNFTNIFISRNPLRDYHLVEIETANDRALYIGVQVNDPEAVPFVRSILMEQTYNLPEIAVYDSNQILIGV